MNYPCSYVPIENEQPAACQSCRSHASVCVLDSNCRWRRLYAAAKIQQFEFSLMNNHMVELSAVELSTAELIEVIGGGIQASGGGGGYGASYQTSFLEPSLLGFIAYMATGYINGYSF